MAQDITALTNAVAGIQGTEASTQALVTGVVDLVTAQSAKIQQLIDQAGQGGVDPAALQALVDSLNTTTTDLAANNQKLADAVAANPVP